MNSTLAGDIELIYDTAEQDTADLIVTTCEKALSLIRDIWGLGPPDDCRIYIMTSWQGFIFRSAPWRWRILLGLSMPLWFFRVRRTWPYSAAWTQRYGERIAIGVKTPRMLELSDKSIGVHMFEKEDGPPHEDTKWKQLRPTDLASVRDLPMID